ncbi:MAG: DUF1348 family protein [Xanthomonadales bacterium]|nr:DUF1348 family protein [Xanthomonadales bacterium]
MSNRSISAAKAAEIGRSIEQALSSHSPSQAIRLVTKEAVWRDKDAVHVGRDEIWSALTQKWSNSLHCTLRQEIESFDARRIVIQFESEWQHSICGRWYRSSGEMRVSVDDHWSLSTIESRQTDTPISASERRLAISMAATSDSAS